MNKLLLMLFVILPGSVLAQWDEDYYKPAAQPRFYLGADAATFRISLKNFKDVYDGRWGDSFGGFAGVRLFGSHYAMIRYGQFQKHGKAGYDADHGQNLKDAYWDESWIKIGLRIHPPVAKKLGSYYGFGFGFFTVDEKEPISVFEFSSAQGKSSDGTGSGFYLEMGIDYFIVDRLAAFFDVEVASGGTRGRSSFEAMSVGGWRFAVGMTIWLF